MHEMERYLLVPTCGLSRWNVEIWDAHEHDPFQNLTIAKTEQLNGQGHMEGKIYKSKDRTP
jgi:hypothetical protein